MSIADNPSWVQAIDDAIAAMRQMHADRGVNVGVYQTVDNDLAWR